MILSKNKAGDILLFQKLIPYYRIEVFKKLYLNFGIITCHSKGLSWSTVKSFYNQLDYFTEILTSFYYRKDETSLIQNVIPVLRRYKPKIVITEFSFKYLTFWVLFLLKFIFRYKLIFWCHGIPNSELNRPFKTIRGKLSLIFYRKADAIIVYSYKRASILQNNLNSTKVFVAANSLFTDKIFTIRNKLSSIGKKKLRDNLGYKERYHLVYIGRLTKEKRLDLLIEVFSILKKKIDVALHVIGTGSEIETLEKAKKEFKNIYLYGEIYDEQKSGELIYASDLMVITGSVGLSILHAYSLSIPVVAFKSINNVPPHGPEIELLGNLQNGILSEMNVN